MARKSEMDNLAKDAAAALASGMSYGKYMALHYKPVEKKPAPKKEEPAQKPVPKKESEGDKVCKICGASFIAARPHQVCCGTACSQENSRRESVEWHRKKRAEEKQNGKK